MLATCSENVFELQGGDTCVGRPENRGPGFFMRSHENSRYAWTDSTMSKEFKDTMQIIDKEKLDIVAELKPEPGKTFAGVEFTRDGRPATERDFDFGQNFRLTAASRVVACLNLRMMMWAFSFLLRSTRQITHCLDISI